MMNSSTNNDAAVSQRSNGGEASSKYERAVQLIDRRDYSDAISLLTDLVQSDPSSANHALLGTAYFLSEKYDRAREHLTLAVEKDPQNLDWVEKLTLAAANAITHVEVDYPPVPEFVREELLAPPSPGDLPDVASGSALPLPSFVARMQARSGVAVSKVVDALSAFAGMVGTAGDVWTNWYQKPLALGILTLSYMRQTLDRNNLKDTYPPGALTAFQARGLVPPPGARYFRTADGSWNNLNNPKEGAAGTRFPRNVDLSRTWPETGARLLTPNPAEISQVLLSRENGKMKEVPFLNLLAACWIQFMVHGWVSHRVSYKLGVHELPLPPGHRARKLFYQTKMFVPKTEVDPTRTASDEGRPPTSINEVTSWWDGSQIYGNDEKTALSLRARIDGKITLDEKGLLPIGEGGIERTGFNRNWWLGLSILHTTFVHEHNAICDMLRVHYPSWSDNRLYNTARLINAAVMAKIHTIEWTPAILPNRGLYMAMNGNWYGFAELAIRRGKRRRIDHPFRIQNAEVGGIVGNRTDKHGVPYGLSEEFTEVYRLHELLPDEVTLRSRLDGTAIATMPLARLRQEGAHEIMRRVAMEDLLFSFGNLHPGQLVLNNFPRTLQGLSVPGNPVYDLGAVDILRARERGVPRYNEFRRQFGLKPIRSFEDLTSDPKDLAALKSIYANDVEALDLHVGSRAESHRPTGFGFGETLFQVFILNASRRLQGDRFYTESYNAEVYTEEGLQWIDAADFKVVLLRHFPALAATGLANVDNAFEPWDTGELTLDRHPLRAFS